ncbi:hypothetical protein CQA53_09175 [Helicobacter didelphidarum]|uniref:Glycosyltransferase family 8 protein n=1 Tax=Helicobacter didelphidarum TaxID=2040648 RepID=A0A3D8IBQ4_9HELI|nr:glycosyltransferase family 8 protein [Helicobacter didelphidarum]RDU62599.1 hypothetical protein CQA53_09175 [Helicobacter didelphidarum]
MIFHERVLMGGGGKLIPVIHCFDDNYALPAAVSFHSMLRHANPHYDYHLYVIHSSNISITNQHKLQETIRGFPNATLTFIDMGGRFDEIWEKCKGKSHYSKDMFYKLSVPNLFPQYDKAIITDVDVVWLGDIAEEFEKLEMSDYYVGGYTAPTLKDNCRLTNFMKLYEQDFTKDEIHKMQIGAGFLVYNLSKMRQDNIEEQMFQYTIDNTYRLIQPEQDVINLVCYPKIQILSKNGMVSTYFWDMFNSDERLENASWNKEEILYAMNNPIQLHYAGRQKPWRDFLSLRANEWFKALIQTNYSQDFLTQLVLHREEYIKNLTQVVLKITPLLVISKFINHKHKIKIDFFGFTLIFPKFFLRIFYSCKKRIIRLGNIYDRKNKK